MGVRVFRSHRIWLSSPHGMKFGLGMVMTGILFAFIIFIAKDRFPPGELIFLIYVSAGTTLLGIIILLRCALNDRDEIHSFLLTDEGDIYHITVAIPDYAIATTSFFDPLGVRDDSVKRTTFSDAVRLACSRDFESKAGEALLNRREGAHLGWMQSNNPYSAAAGMNKMEDPVIEKITISGATIRYKMENRDVFSQAKLYRHNRGYKIILDWLRDHK